MPPGTLPAEYVRISSVLAVLSDVYLNTDRIFYHKTIVLYHIQKNFIHNRKTESMPAAESAEQKADRQPKAQSEKQAGSRNRKAQSRPVTADHISQTGKNEE